MAVQKMPTFDDFIQSDLFTFYIGQERRRFVVHATAITATSPVFDSLINGGLKESQHRSAEIEHVDPETFIRFLEYAYRGDYTLPSWADDTPTTAPDGNGFTKHDEPSVPTEALKIVREAFNYPETNWSNSKSAPSDYGAVAFITTPPKPNAPHPTRSSFSKREYKHPAHDPSPPLPPPSSPPQPLAPILLAHARLYTFADMRIAPALKALVLHKLHKTLAALELCAERVPDVIELVRYAYEHGEDRASDGRIDALRDLVVAFVVAEMKVLAEGREVRELMEAGGEFAGDFWDRVSVR